MEGNRNEVEIDREKLSCISRSQVPFQWNRPRVVDGVEPPWLIGFSVGGGRVSIRILSESFWSNCVSLVPMSSRDWSFYPSSWQDGPWNKIRKPKHRPKPKELRVRIQPKIWRHIFSNYQHFCSPPTTKSIVSFPFPASILIFKSV